MSPNQRIDVYHHFSAYPCTVVWVLSIIATALIVYFLGG